MGSSNAALSPVAEDDAEFRRGVGSRIRAARRAMGVTIAEVSARSATHQSQVSRIENGHRLPYGSTLVRLAKELEVSIDWILTGEAPRTIPERTRLSFEVEKQATRAEPDFLDGILEVAREVRDSGVDVSPRLRSRSASARRPATPVASAEIVKHDELRLPSEAAFVLEIERRSSEGFRMSQRSGASGVFQQALMHRPSDGASAFLVWDDGVLP